MECREMIISEDYADFIMEIFSERGESKNKSQNDCTIYPGIDYAFIYKSINSIIGTGLSSYSYEEIPKLYGLMDTNAVESTGALKLQNIPGLELNGSEIIVAIIDNGIDAYHEAFRFSNGNTRILSIWNQEDQSLDTPKYFQYGSEIRQDKINEELKKSESVFLKNLALESEHGTFVAGIAAGNNNVEIGFSSPAPMAQIVVIKLKRAKLYLKDYYFLKDNAVAYQENDIINAVVYANRISDEYKKPMIICIPLGTNQGSHGGLSVIGDFLNNYASRTGIGIVCAIGNEGNSRHHYKGKINKKDDFDDAQLRVGANVKGLTIELWGESPDLFEIEIISPTGERIKRVRSSIGQEEIYKLLFEKTVIYIKYELVERKTGQELIMIRLDQPTEGVWTFRVFGELIVSGSFNIWIPITEFIGEETYFLKPEPFITLTNPSDTYIPITVGAYSNTTEALYINSGRGYPTDMTVKPTFAAPGVNVLGPAPNNNYVRLSGTSVAAGMTAGVMAQFMEWGIIKGNKVNLNTIEIKNYLIRGAERKSSLSYPNREWGFGTLDVYNSIDILRT